jgi:hypothetical protein
MSGAVQRVHVDAMSTDSHLWPWSRRMRLLAQRPDRERREELFAGARVLELHALPRSTELS